MLNYDVYYGTHHVSDFPVLLWEGVVGHYLFLTNVQLLIIQRCSIIQTDLTALPLAAWLIILLILHTWLASPLQKWHGSASKVLFCFKGSCQVQCDLCLHVSDENGMAPPANCCFAIHRQEHCQAQHNPKPI